MTTRRQDASRSWLVAVSIGIGVLLFTRVRAEIPAYVALHQCMADHGVPDHVRNLDAKLLMLLAAFAGAWVAARRRALASLGLWSSIPQGLLFGLIAGLPMLAMAAISSTEVQLGWPTMEGSLIAPMVEEVFFRGLLVAVPVCIGRMSFWPVAIASSLLFGSLHVPWNDTLEPGHIWPFLITGGGGLWYAWLARTYDWNLWVTISLHAAMNAAWLVFAVGGGAVGSGLWSNVGRALTIAAGTAMALKHRRRQQAI